MNRTDNEEEGGLNVTGTKSNDTGVKETEKPLTPIKGGTGKKNTTKPGKDN